MLRGQPATPATIADRLIHLLAGVVDEPAAFIRAAATAQGQLRTALSRVLGETGFDALWARALALVPTTRPDLAPFSPAIQALRRGANWEAAFSNHAPAEVQAAVAAALTSFITLLFTFVGPGLGLRLLGQVWPELLVDSPDPPQEAHYD